MDFKYLKQIRKEKGITLVKLGEMTGFSASFLSQIERGLNQPSLQSLRKISAALDIDVAKLLATSSSNQNIMSIDNNKFKIFKEKDSPMYTPWPDSKTFSQTLFNLPINTDDLIFSKMKIYPNTSCSGQQISHQKREINYIISGTATFEIENETIILQKGDSIFLNSDTPHNIFNNESNPLDILCLQL